MSSKDPWDEFEPYTGPEEELPTSVAKVARLIGPLILVLFASGAGFALAAFLPLMGRRWRRTSGAEIAEVADDPSSLLIRGAIGGAILGVLAVRFLWKARRSS